MLGFERILTAANGAVAVVGLIQGGILLPMVNLFIFLVGARRLFTNND